MSARFDFHGVRIAVDAEDARVEEAIADRLRHFRDRAPGAPDLTFRFEIVESPAHHVVDRPAGDSRPVYDSPVGEVAYFAGTQELSIDVEDRVRVRSSPERGHVAYSVVAGREDLWLLSRPLFTLPFVEQLKRLGRYSVHAAGVACDGRAILMPAGSGSGKSTLAVALAREGFDFLADDMVFLAGERDEVRVLGFPDEIDVTDRTASWFPELRHLVGTTTGGWPKHRVRHEDAFPAAVAAPGPPALLVFPSIGTGPHSELHELDPETALLELAPNVLLTDPEASQRHLDALAALVRASRCHRLVTGRDFDRVARMLRELVR